MIGLIALIVLGGLLTLALWVFAKTQKHLLAKGKSHSVASAWACGAEKVTESPFNVKPDHFQNISPFTSYLLSIHGACALGVTHFRLTLPENLADYQDMIEYYGSREDMQGYGHFPRR